MRGIAYDVCISVCRIGEREVTSHSSAAWRPLTGFAEVIFAVRSERARERNRGKAGEEVMGEGTTPPAGMQYSPDE